MITSPAPTSNARACVLTEYTGTSGSTAATSRGKRAASGAGSAPVRIERAKWRCCAGVKGTNTSGAGVTSGESGCAAAVTPTTVSQGESPRAGSIRRRRPKGSAPPNSCAAKSPSMSATGRCSRRSSAPKPRPETRWMPAVSR